MGSPPLRFQFSDRRQIRKISLQRSQRILSSNTVRNQKEIITPEAIKSIVETDKDSNNLSEDRSVVIYLITFLGFMHISELLALKLPNVKFTETGMTIFIENLKSTNLEKETLSSPANFKLIAAPSNGYKNISS